jgi:predicted esterase
MLLLLHGTGGDGAAMIDLFRGHAAREGIILLALTARGENWDSVDLFFDDYEAGRRPPAGQWSKPQFGKDLDRVDAALAALFARVAVDPRRVGVAGFSHGASYALMLGTANPQLFGTIVALSPGILIVGDPPGGQNVYVAHGKGDTAQPYSRTEKVFVPRLGQLGYRVTFQPFAGGHGIPREVLAKAVRFFLTAKPPGNSEAIPGAGAGRPAGRAANPREPVRRGQAALTAKPPSPRSEAAIAPPLVPPPEHPAALAGLHIRLRHRRIPCFTRTLSSRPRSR